MRCAPRSSLRISLAVLLAVAGLGVAAPSVAQQLQPNFGKGRDCQVVRTCNFSRTGSYRGCLSSYTCRTCRLVRTRCSIAGRTYCEEFVCGWGG